jgi:hypothetical protein
MYVKSASTLVTKADGLAALQNANPTLRVRTMALEYCNFKDAVCISVCGGWLMFLGLRQARSVADGEGILSTLQSLLSISVVVSCIRHLTGAAEPTGGGPPSPRGPLTDVRGGVC